MSSDNTKIEEESTESKYDLYLRFDKYVVRRIDAYNIVVEEMRIVKTGDNAGAEYPVNVGYYKKLYSALDKILNLGIEKKSIKGLTDVVTALKDAEKVLYKELEDKYNRLDKKD